MKHASLFSGIGGFDLAAQRMGWENMFHCEWNKFCQQILKYYWPGAKSYDDIRKTDFSIWRNRIDILTGGFPCQPYSVAGKQLGTDDERHLWPEMLRAIREIKPRWIVGENVRGLVNWNDGLVFEQVQIDLENEGYEVQPYLLPAAGINAPHERYRIWFVAYANSNDAGRCGYGKTRPSESSDQIKQEKRKWFWNIFERISRKRITANSKVQRSRRLCIRENEEATEYGGISKNGDVANSNGIRLRRKGNGIGKTKFFGEDGQKYDWRNFPTQSPISLGDDGLSAKLDGITFSKWRSETIKGAGNAIVPGLAEQIFKSIIEFEKLNFYGN